MNGTPIHLMDNQTQTYNGRVNIMDNTNQQSYPLFLKTKSKDNFQKEALKGIQSGTILNTLFFSKKNVDDLQQMIRYNIYIMSNKKHIIDKQSETELHIVMRAYYLQYARNLSTNIKEQIKELNSMVLDWVLPKIMTQIEQYLVFKKQVSGVYEPIDRQINVSNAGTKTLELKTFF